MKAQVVMVRLGLFSPLFSIVPEIRKRVLRIFRKRIIRLMVVETISRSLRIFGKVPEIPTFQGLDHSFGSEALSFFSKKKLFIKMINLKFYFFEFSMFATRSLAIQNSILDC